MSQHEVVVQFQYGRPDWDEFFEFESGFEARINDSGVGEYDGSELAVDLTDGLIYLYGPDGDKLYATARPMLEDCEFMRGAVITIYYGAEEDARSKEISLGA